jgi:hypothetical protein
MPQRRSWAALLAGAVAALTSALSVVLATHISRVWFWSLAGLVSAGCVIFSVAQFLVANEKDPPDAKRGTEVAEGPIRQTIVQRLVLSKGDIHLTNNISVEPDRIRGPLELSTREAYLASLEKHVNDRLSEGLDAAVRDTFGGGHDIALTFASRPGLVRDRQFPPFGLADRILDPGLTAMQAFEQAGRSVMLVGSSGAGKTTALLHLVREQAVTARGGSPSGALPPVPVWLSLRAWPRASSVPFAEWLVSSLGAEHGVPEAVAREWLAAGRLVLFLDSLGELESADRTACVRVLNAFVKEHPLHGMAICGRDARDTAVGGLALNAALEVMPLTETAIRDFLLSLGDRCAALLAVLDTDQGMAELLQTPYMLCTAVLAYADRKPGELGRGSMTRSRYSILDAYVDRVLERQEQQSVYDYQTRRPVAKKRLSYLAQRMIENGWYEIWEVPQAALISGAALRRTLKVGPPLVTGIGAAFACGLAVFLFMGRVPGAIVGGLVLTAYVAIYVAGVAGGWPQLAHLPDTKLTFDSKQMLSRRVLAVRIPLALLAILATAYFASSVGWNPSVPWQDVPTWQRVAFWVCMFMAALTAPAAILSGGLKAVTVDRDPAVGYLESTVHADLRIMPQIAETLAESAKAFAKWLAILFPVFFVLRYAFYWIAVEKYEEYTALPVYGGVISHYFQIDGTAFFHMLFVDVPAGVAIDRPVIWPLLTAGALALAIGTLNAALYIALGIEWTVSNRILVAQDRIDPDFPGFLQYVARLPLLRMTGGGYEFYHAELRDYFAARLTPPAPAANTASRGTG